jgi:hypothetical protein
MLRETRIDSLIEVGRRILKARQSGARKLDPSNIRLNAAPTIVFELRLVVAPFRPLGPSFY